MAGSADTCWVCYSELLAQHSPKLAAMLRFQRRLNRGDKDATERLVLHLDCSPALLRALVYFICCDCIPELPASASSACSSPDDKFSHLLDLASLADEFFMPRLAYCVERLMLPHLTPARAVCLFESAQLLGRKAARRSAAQFLLLDFQERMQRRQSAGPGRAQVMGEGVGEGRDDDDEGDEARLVGVLRECWEAPPRD